VEVRGPEWEGCSQDLGLTRVEVREWSETGCEMGWGFWDMTGPLRFLPVVHFLSTLLITTPTFWQLTLASIVWTSGTPELPPDPPPPQLRVRYLFSSLLLRPPFMSASIPTLSSLSSSFRSTLNPSPGYH
jgi:hypothetical protein